MKRTFISILLLLPLVNFAQPANIKFQLKQATNSNVILAYYYVDEVYTKDTLAVDAKGWATYQSDEPLQQGLYKLFLDDKNNFDFLLGVDQSLTIKNPTFNVKNVKIKGAKETEAFAKYMVYLNDLQEKNRALVACRDTVSEDEKATISKEIATIKPKLEQYWLEAQKRYPGTFYAKFLMANYIPKPERTNFSAKIQQNDSLWSVAKYQYQKNHYWDYLDYTDERFMYTPLLKPRLDMWFKDVLYQNYDTIQPHVINMIERARSNKKTFQFLTSYFLNNSLSSNILGMDALFVDVANKYFLSGDADWVSEQSMEKVKENVAFLENNLVGKKAPDLTLEDIDGEYQNLHSIDAPYTMVLLYEPNCSHCKKTIPAIHDKVYKKFHSKGLKIYAIYSMDNKKEWVDFVEKHQLTDWINVWDKNGISNFKVLYDGRLTPAVYVLDENKKIILKKMSVEQLENFFREKLQ